MNHIKKHKIGARRPALLFSLLVCGLLISSALLPHASRAQSGRQPAPPPSQSSGLPGKTTEAKAGEKRPQDSRPRRVNEEEEGQDDAAIRLSADLVTVITSVTDSVGNHVNDLAQKDFVVYEDGVPQEIAGLYRENDLPLRLIFLFDTSTSIRHRFDFEQRAAAQFFRQIMKAGDQAAIISVSTDAKLEAQFTPSVESLVDTLARLKPEGATALYNALIDAAKYIRPAEGRRVLVVLSDGTDTSSGATLAQALTEVQKSDVVIYGVHSTGVAPSANVQDLAGEFVLKAISEDTGGRAFFPPIHEDQKKEVRELDEVYRRIAAELRAQYVLTYYSTSKAKAGDFRTIKVEAKRPGLQARARRGYYTSQAR
ncbi:MAG TPA: VWA domain-containing protein [Blastocatellia bacterium]|nr:VWA domain-containing protein [Blastocatellia bacterium]